MIDSTQRSRAGSLPGRIATRLWQWSRWQPAATASIVVLMTLVGYTQLVGFETLHIFGMSFTLNDQVVYVDAARHLRDDCELTTGIIYPDTLRQGYSRNYLYMPGHAVLLAISLVLFGDGVWQAILPSVIAYLISVVLVFLIGRRLATASIGIWAALLFAVFAPNVLYAMTAMAESTFLCAGLMAFCFFLFLPARLWPFLGPLLLIPPFLFRESGSLWVISMAFVISSKYSGSRRGHVVATAFVVASVAVLFSVYQIEWLSDRPSRFLQNLLTSHPTEVYKNAFAVTESPESVGEWVGLFGSHAVVSVSGLFRVMSAEPTSFEAISLHVLLWPLGVVLLLWWLEIGVQLLNRVCLVTGLVLAVFISFLYYWEEYIGVRHLLLLLPLESIALVAAANHCLSRLDDRKRCFSAAVVVLFIALGSGYQLREAAREVTERDGFFEAVESSVQAVGPDRENTLIAPFWVGLPFVHSAYPARWAFPPANPETLALLHEKYPVTTAILPLPAFRRLGSDVLGRIALSYSGTVELGGVKQVVYRSAGASPKPE